MRVNFLGNGWRFPILPDPLTRGLGYCAGDDNVLQSLRILVLTAAGERVMRPTFGTEVPRLNFAPGSEYHLRLLESSIRDAVRDWEPRVELTSVVAEPDSAEESRVCVHVAFRVRATNTKLNVVYPFYLDNPVGAP